MKNAIIAIALGAIGLSAAPALADQPVNARQLNQERRIDAGQRSGKLSPRESARLDQEQRSIRQLEDRLRARHGGRLTAADKRLIHQRQEAANRHILQQKRDAQRGKNHLKL